MVKKTKLVDTNILLRFLVADEPSQAGKVEKLFIKAGKKELEIKDVVLAEAVWILLSFYKVSKKEVIEKLEGILAFEKFKLNKLILKKAIEVYRNNNISFVDAYLGASSNVEKKGLYTFDKDLKKVEGLKIKDF
jgi:predicted nucleic-acid-binding protein